MLNRSTTSITSSIYQGYIENGRRYQTTHEGEYLVPSDEKQVSLILHTSLLLSDNSDFSQVRSVAKRPSDACHPRV